MAKVVKPKAKTVVSGEDDLAVLHPNRTINIAGRNVTVREYGWVEGLKLRAKIQPIVTAFQAVIESGRVPSGEQIELILSAHCEVTVELMTIAADVDVAFINTLNAADGALLEMAWWGCNGHFFIQKAVNNIARVMLATKQLAGQTSTQSSSVTGTTQKD